MTPRALLLGHGPTSESLRIRRSDGQVDPDRVQRGVSS